METPQHDQRQDYEDLNSPPLIGPPAPDPLPPRRKPNRASKIVGFLIGVLVPLGFFSLVLFPSVCGLRDAAQRMQSANSLKMIGIGIHNYEATYDELPQDTYSLDGKPMLSWRVHLLPFVEEDMLYKQFRLDEPWDSPNNLPLLQKIPKFYARPADRNAKQHPVVTHYRGFSNPGAVFERRPTTPPWQHLFVGPAGVLPRPIPLRPAFRLGSIQDGLSNTIFVVEAADAVEWTKPDELDASISVPKLGGLWRGDRFNALFGDGSVRSMKTDKAEETLKALISHSGGETLPPSWDN